MADFDPDKYLEQKTGSASASKAFDPDTYLAEKTGTKRTYSPHIDLMEGQSPGAKWAAGVGLGALNTGRSIAELIGHIPGLREVSKSALAHLEEPDRDVQSALLSDPKGVVATVPSWVPLAGNATITPGNVGNFTGEMLATAPIGGVAGGLTKKALAKVGVKALAELGAAEGGQYLARAATKLVPLAAEGMAQGNVLAGPGNRLQGTLEGGFFAPALGAGLSLPGLLARGLVKPSTEAAELLRRGVPLSIGQMNAGGALSKIEEAGAHSALGGEAIEAARQAGREGWQKAVAEAAAAPGETVSKGAGADMGSVLDELHQGFDKAYEPVRNTPMPAHYEGVPTSQAMREAFKAASGDPSVAVTEGTRTAVDKFLQNQATILKRAHQFDLGGSEGTAAAKGVERVKPLQALPRTTAPLEQQAFGDLVENTASMKAPARAAAESAPQAFTTAEPLLKVRSNIRKEIRRIGKSPGADQDALPLLQNAEGVVTRTLEEQMGAEASAKLRAVDAQYSKFKVLEDAVARAGDSELGMTPAQLQTAVRKATPTSEYARGGGGTLRELAKLGRAALENKAARNGAIKQTLPLGLNHAAGPVGAFLNGPGRDFAMGNMPSQLRARTLLDLLSKAQPQSDFAPSANAYLAPLEVDRR